MGTRFIGGAFAFSDMEVWDAGGDGVTHFDCADLGEPWLGHIIEPRFIQAALWQQLQSIESVSLYCPVRFQAITILDDRVEVDLDDAQQLTAALVLPRMVRVLPCAKPWVWQRSVMTIGKVVWSHW